MVEHKINLTCQLDLSFVISKYIVEVESNLPDNIKDRAVSVFKAAVSEKYPIKDAIEKVQREALCEVDTVFKGQRFKVKLCLHRHFFNIFFHFFWSKTSQD